VALRAEKLPQGQYQVVHVAERDRERTLGGVSYVVVNPVEETKS
jgi:hypothetical protein